MMRLIHICFWLTIVFTRSSRTFPDESPEFYIYASNQYPPHHQQSPHSYLPAPHGKRPACAGPTDTFCTKIDYYPTEIIKDLVERYSFDFKTLLQDESMDLVTLGNPTVDNSTDLQITSQTQTRQPNSGSKSNIGNYNWRTRMTRFSPSLSQSSKLRSDRVPRQVSNEEKLCPTTSSYVMPRAAVNTRGTWMYVVNLEGNELNTQLVRTERCATNECSGLCQVPAGYSSSCSQQYVQKRLVALNANGESLYTDTFWFPHCCICQIRSQL